MKTNKKTILIIALLALVSLMIAPVMAETLTGDISSSGIESSNYYKTGSGGGAGGNELRWVLVNAESTEGATYWVHFDLAGTKGTFDVGAPDSASTPFMLNSTMPAQVIGTGTFGYQRFYDNAWPTPNEIEGYQYIIFDTWNVTGLTGTLSTVGGTLTGAYNQTALYHAVSQTGTYCATFTDAPTGYLYLDLGSGGFAKGTQSGSNTFNRRVNFAGSYSATKPAGLGISGFVNKYSMGDPSTKYNSRAYIVDATTNLGLTSEGVISDDNFNFTVPAQSIIIALKDSVNVWHNSTILFAPTVTPTPTTTWTDTDPKPVGYTRTWFNAVDGTAGSVIYGAALKLKDVQNGSWKNNTAGYSYIDTLPNHTIDAYGSMTGYSSDTRLALPAADTVYELTLWSGLLAPGSGNVNLLVVVTDATTGYALDRVSLTSTIPSGAQTGGMTGSAGTETFVVPNMSFITVTATKSGYRSATGTITTTAFGPDTLRIPLSKLTVTPTITATPLPGEVTPRPTTDPNDPSLHGGDTSLKAQEMMNWLAMNGMDLVQLCFLVTVLALLGVKFGK